MLCHLVAQFDDIFFVSKTTFLMVMMVMMVMIIIIIITIIITGPILGYNVCTAYAYKGI